MHTTREQVLRQLQRHPGEFISGGTLSTALGLTRAAVWKAVEALRAEGWPVEAVSRRGYRLAEPEGGFLTEEGLRQQLDGCWIGRQLFLLPEVDSTNAHAKRLSGGLEEGAVIAVDRQTAGRGRLQRQFYSPEREGVYFSVLLRPRLHLRELSVMAMCSAVSAAEAVEELTGLRPEIKWPNDLLWQGKKLCGILSESSVESETGRVQELIIGIGLNVNNLSFPPKLEGKAVSLRQMCGKVIPRAAVIGAVLRRLSQWLEPGGAPAGRQQLAAAYRREVGCIGRQVALSYPDRQMTGRVLGVDDAGRLVLRLEDGRTETVFSGELQILSEAERTENQ